MKHTKITLKEAYRTLFEMEDKIEFLQYYINEELEKKDTLTQECINRIKKINKNMNELEKLTQERNVLYKKLQNFDSVYIDMES